MLSQVVSKLADIAIRKYDPILSNLKQCCLHFTHFCQLWIFRLQPANIYCSASQNVTIALPLNNSHLFRCQAFVLSSIKDLLSSPVTRFLNM